jgi:hypothetical protein
LVSICIEQLLIDSQIEQIKSDCKIFLTSVTVKYMENETLKSKYEQEKQKLIEAQMKFEDKLCITVVRTSAAIESILLNNFDLRYAQSTPSGKIIVYVHTLIITI